MKKSYGICSVTNSYTIERMPVYRYSDRHLMNVTFLNPEAHNRVSIRLEIKTILQVHIIIIIILSLLLLIHLPGKTLFPWKESNNRSSISFLDLSISLEFVFINIICSTFRQYVAEKYPKSYLYCLFLFNPFEAKNTLSCSIRICKIYHSVSNTEENFLQDFLYILKHLLQNIKKILKIFFPVGYNR